MSFWSEFLENALKKLLAVKNTILAFFGGYKLFCNALKKYCRKQQLCVYVLFLKLRQKKNMKKYLLKGFCFKTHKRAFLGSTNFFNFFSVLALKTIDTQILFWSIFFKIY